MSAAALAAKAAKKLVLDLLSDSENGLKNILFIIFIPIFFFVLLFVVPVVIFMNLPTILFGGGNGAINNGFSDEQLKYIAIYQQAPDTINKENLKWIDEQKNKYSGYDDVVVKTNYTLTWQSILAIDTARLKQDFTKCNEEDVMKLARMFVDRKITTETYEVQESYEEEEKYDDIDENGKKVTKKKMVTKYRTVTKNRVVINISTKSFETVLASHKLDDFQNEAANNYFNTLLNMDVEGNLNIYDGDLTNLKEYPPGDAIVPYFNQTDVRWGNSSYGSSTIASGGCGPTSLAIVVSGLIGRKDINPKIVADWSVVNGHRAEGAGSYWSLMTAGGSYYGLKVERASRKDANKIIQSLSQGKPIIVSMGRGHFTRTGHFIVLRGLTNDGKVLVNDPASFNRTQQEWDINIIMGESSTNEGVNGSPFWIFTK